MRKIVIFTMILTLIFVSAGCTVHSEPDKKAAESSSANVVIHTTQAEDLSEKTENEKIEKSTFAQETTQPTIVEIDNNVKVDIYFTAIGMFDILTEQELLKAVEELKTTNNIQKNRHKERV